MCRSAGVYAKWPCAPSWCKPLEEANSSGGFDEIADLFHNVFHSFCEDRVTIAGDVT
jgi:hypothetical protein